MDRTEWYTVSREKNEYNKCYNKMSDTQSSCFCTMYINPFWTSNSRFSSNFEAFASELLENSELFPQYSLHKMIFHNKVV